MNSPGLKLAFKTMRAHFRRACVIEALRIPGRLDARFGMRNVGPGLSRVNQRADGNGSEVEVLFAGDFCQPQRVSWRAADHRGPEIPHHVKTLQRIPSAAGNHHCPKLPHSFDSGPKADEGAKGERKKHAVFRGHACALQHVNPASAPPLPTLRGVDHAQGSARGYGSVMRARGVMWRKSSVRSEGRRLVLRAE